MMMPQEPVTTLPAKAHLRNHVIDVTTVDVINRKTFYYYNSVNPPPPSVMQAPTLCNQTTTRMCFVDSEEDLTASTLPSESEFQKDYDYEQEKEGCQPQMQPNPPPLYPFTSSSLLSDETMEDEEEKKVEEGEEEGEVCHRRKRRSDSVIDLPDNFNRCTEYNKRIRTSSLSRGRKFSYTPRFSKSKSDAIPRKLALMDWVLGYVEKADKDQLQLIMTAATRRMWTLTNLADQ